MALKKAEKEWAICRYEAAKTNMAVGGWDGCGSSGGAGC